MYWYICLLFVSMPKVWADDEEVIFQEGIPDNSQKIYELMMGALGEQRKAVRSR